MKYEGYFDYRSVYELTIESRHFELTFGAIMLLREISGQFWFEVSTEPSSKDSFNIVMKDDFNIVRDYNKETKFLKFDLFENGFLLGEMELCETEFIFYFPGFTPGDKLYIKIK